MLKLDPLICFLCLSGHGDLRTNPSSLHLPLCYRSGWRRTSYGGDHSHGEWIDDDTITTRGHSAHRRCVGGAQASHLEPQSRGFRRRAFLTFTRRWLSACGHLTRLHAPPCWPLEIPQWQRGATDMMRPVPAGCWLDHGCTSKKCLSLCPSLSLSLGPRVL